MNVKELSRMCSEPIKHNENEIIQDFWNKQRKKAFKTLANQLMIMIIILISLTVFFGLATKHISIELITSLIPFYVLIIIPHILMTASCFINDKIVSTTLDNAIRENNIKVSECRYKLFSINKTSNNKSSSTYYYFVSEKEMNDRFNVGRGQHKCFFDEALQGYKYKIYAIDNKYIFFIRADNE